MSKQRLHRSAELKSHVFTGAKPTNQVLVFIPIIAFIEDCLIVKSVVTVHPWLIGLEVLGEKMLLLISR